MTVICWECGQRTGTWIEDVAIVSAAPRVTSRHHLCLPCADRLGIPVPLGSYQRPRVIPENATVVAVQLNLTRKNAKPYLGKGEGK